MANQAIGGIVARQFAPMLLHGIKLGGTAGNVAVGHAQGIGRIASIEVADIGPSELGRDGPIQRYRRYATERLPEVHDFRGPIEPSIAGN